MSLELKTEIELSFLAIKKTLYFFDTNLKD